MCREICDGAGAGICDGAPSTCSSFFFFFFLGFTVLSRIVYLNRADRSSKTGENRRTRGKTTDTWGQ